MSVLCKYKLVIRNALQILLLPVCFLGGPTEYLFFDLIDLPHSEFYVFSQGKRFLNKYGQNVALSGYAV